MQLKGFWGRLAKAMYDTKGASTFTCMLSQMQARRRGQPIFGGSGKSIIHGPSQLQKNMNTTEETELQKQNKKQT